MWNQAVANVIGRPVSMSSVQSALSYLSLHTTYFHWRKLFVCLLKCVLMIKLDAKEIEISKKSEILLRISCIG